MAKKLNLCPFCQSEARIFEVKLWLVPDVVKYLGECLNLNCAAHTKTYHTKEKAMAAWNCREITGYKDTP